jgi:hypothetical protein
MIFPEDRTETEVERDIICNRLIREVCMHEQRLAKAMARDAGRSEATADDCAKARHTTHGPDGIRDAINRLYGWPPGDR